MKNKVLAIFKYPRAWNIDVINRFSNYYDTEYLYISDYKNKNFTEVVNEINSLIKLKNIEIVVFDVDYFRFINFFFSLSQYIINLAKPCDGAPTSSAFIKYSALISECFLLNLKFSKIVLINFLIFKWFTIYF